MLRLAILAVGLVSLSACATSRIQAHPATLDEVNDTLAGRWATVQLVSGKEIDVEDVWVSPDTTRFTVRRTGSGRHVPTDSVSVVSLRPLSRSGGGGLVGAAPGAFIVALGFGIRSIDESEGGRIPPDVSGNAMMALGAVVMVVGGIIGAVVVRTPGQAVPIYRSPVSRYLSAPPVTPR